MKYPDSVQVFSRIKVQLSLVELCKYTEDRVHRRRRHLWHDINDDDGDDNNDDV